MTLNSNQNLFTELQQFLTFKIPEISFNISFL